MNSYPAILLDASLREDVVSCRNTPQLFLCSIEVRRDRRRRHNQIRLARVMRCNNDRAVSRFNTKPW
jgi:hypothetical protein